MIHILSYRGQSPLEIKEQNNWTALSDGILPNFKLHLFSLRWLNEVDLATKLKVVTDFIDFHEKKESVSDFYIGARADHAIAIRIQVLTDLIKKENDKLGRLFSRILIELEKYVGESIHGSTYRERCNHGLMLDSSLLYLLTCSSTENIVKKHILLILNRLQNQISWIFSSDGYSREHSVSYQEYNLYILFQIDKNLSGCNHFKEVNKYYTSVFRPLYETVKSSSRKLLGYALKQDGETYINFGDSPCPVKSKILKNVFCVGANTGLTNSEILAPYSLEHGIFFSKTAGFFFLRNDHFHFGFTCSWNSHIHKQDDDLAIFLSVDGSPFIIDGGYSGFVKDIQSSSVDQHSAITVVGKNWSSRGNAKRHISTLDMMSTEPLKISGRHDRILGYLIERQIEANKNQIRINDRVDGVSNEEMVRHRFLINSDVGIVIKNSIVYFSNSCEILVYGECQIEVSKIDVVAHNEKYLATALDFFSSGELTFTIRKNHRVIE